MKMIKRCSLAAAICLACGVNSAQATINNGAPTIQALGSGTSGEMFLKVFDAGIATSFAIDLGVSVEDFLANASISRSWDLGTTFTNFAALSTNALMFNVAGNNTYPLVTSGNTNYGVLISRQHGQMTYDTTTMTLTTLNNSFGVTLPAAAININTGMTAGQTDFATNSSFVTSDINNMAYWSKSGGENFDLANYVASATVRNGAVPDQTLDLGWLHSPTGPIKSNTKALWNVQNGYLTLDVSASQLTWHSNVAAVPLPGTAWLFLSGLLAALGFKKRTAFHLAA